MKNAEETEGSNARSKYHRHLRNTLLLAEVVSTGAFLTGYLMALSLIIFTITQGTTFIQPILALYILIASVLLFIVASISMTKTRELILKEEE